MGDRRHRHRTHKSKGQQESSSRQQESSSRHQGSSSRQQESSSRVSSGVYNDNYLQPPPSVGGGVYGSGSSRAEVSRYSLTEQFAATRREFEFGFDDGASSVWERGTLASEDPISVYQQQQQQQQQEEEAASEQIPSALRDIWLARNFYELLCLAPNAPMDEVRRAYYRNFFLLHPDVHPASARQVAQIYWDIIQEAFETLSDPRRRLAYERECLGESDPDSDLLLSASPFQTLDVAMLRDGRVRGLTTFTLQDRQRPKECTQSSRPVGTLEADIFPAPAVEFRLTHSAVLPGDTKQSIVQVASKHFLWNKGLPHVSALLQRPTAGGVFQCKAESGDWLARPDQLCRTFSQISQLNKMYIRKYLGRYFSFIPPVALPPRLELSYTTQYSTRSASYLDPVPRAVGNKNTSNRQDGFWTFWASAEPGCLGSSAMYSVSLASLLSWPRRCFDKLLARKPARSPSSKDTEPRFGDRMRLEGGVSWTSTWANVFTLRCLRAMGRSSALGFEVGLTADNLHLALCWSRLPGGTIRLPFFVCPTYFYLRARRRTALLWGAVVPFATLAVWEFIRYHERSAAAKRRAAWRQATTPQRQAEADEVTFLLADHVQKRQAAQRVPGSSGGDLVIVSAKYGVKAAVPEDEDEDAEIVVSNAWGAAEVADTTVAVAALVSDGRLYIPAGLEKSNLLGFWDPAPTAEKVLHVRYSYRGLEDVVEVSGDEELRLPPEQGEMKKEE